ncbi:MAG: GGDEF domain-containing protein [Vicinamibacteria bacterium]
MELTLWRWSIGVQISSLALIVAFFLVLQRSLPPHAISSWVRAWIFNLLALIAALAFWLYPPSDATRPIAYFLFMLPKNAAILYFVQGAWSLHRPGARLIGPAQLFVAVLIFPLAGGWLFRSVEMLGAGQQLFIGLMFVPTGIALFRTRDRALDWLATGFLVRGSLCLVEAGGYMLQLTPPDMLSAADRSALGTFLAVHSSFDVGAEWLLALGFVLAISLRAQRELHASIQELHAAQDGLRRLVDHDPLTALSNRRALPGILRAAQPEGATLLFFDLNDFKEVNDAHGHEAGDRCLQRFADALRESFRPGDAFVRYGGDEFLIVAKGLEKDLADVRVEGLRLRLAADVEAGPKLKFSVGISQLPPGGRPEDALREADGLMYAAKTRG